MFPYPNKDKTLKCWIDSLDFNEILMLMHFWNETINFDEKSEIIDILKEKFKKSNMVKKFYDDSIKKEHEKSMFDEISIARKPSIKRSRYTSNCGGSQCEFRFNGCSHSP